MPFHLPPRGAVGLVALVAWTWVSLVVAAPTWRSPSAGIESRASARVVYAVGARLCHQRPERSFTRQGVALPVCGRCVGLYVGGAFGLLLATWRRPSGDHAATHWRRLVGIAALPTLATLLAEWVSPALVTTAVRAASGVPLGAAAGWMIGAAGMNLAVPTDR